MEISKSTISQQLPRTCVHCGSIFEFGNAKRRHCSDTCKSAYNREKKAQRSRQNEETIKLQTTEIKELIEAPVRRTESIRVVNPAWQVAKQIYSTQKMFCNDLESQLAALQATAREMKKGSWGAYLGALVGIAIVLFFAATRYDSRHKKPLGTTFVVSLLFGLIGMGIVGFWIGQKWHSDLLVHDGQVNMDSDSIAEQCAELIEQLNTGRKYLCQLRQQLDQLPQFEGQTVSSVEEIRIPTQRAK